MGTSKNRDLQQTRPALNSAAKLLRKMVLAALVLAALAQITFAPEQPFGDLDMDYPHTETADVDFSTFFDSVLLCVFK